MQTFWTTGDLAKLAALSPQAVRIAVERGRLRIAARTAAGIRLISVEEVERFLRARHEAGRAEGIAIGESEDCPSNRAD
jgi:DNA-binding transcriptional MerR regulator